MATNQAYVASSASTGDRLSFTIFIAFAFHVAIILGVAFKYSTNQLSTHTMEITLAHQESRNKPIDPDFIANVNQLGSGLLEEKKLLTSNTERPLHDIEIRQNSQALTINSSIQNKEKKFKLVTTKAISKKKAEVDESLSLSISGTHKEPPEISIKNRALEIASLQARLDSQQQEYAKRPRIKRLTSLATASSNDAFYLHSWRRKIEKIGNLNYPEEARRRKLYGSLRLMVSISPDGALQEVELLESSGHKILDDAAIRIVKIASPFAPFPDELRRTTDILEIIRTWQFRKNSSLKSY